MKLHTDADVAEMFGLTVEDVRAKCPERNPKWPHLRPKRSVWRFTDEQVAEITRIEARRPSTKTATEQAIEAKLGKVPQPTARSRRRSA